MPTYEYKCSTCGHRFDEIRPISSRRDPIPCPECQAGSGELQLSVPQMGIVKGKDSDSFRRKMAEDSKIARKAERARELKRTGEVPMQEPIGMKDKRIQDV